MLSLILSSVKHIPKHRYLLKPLVYVCAVACAWRSEVSLPQSVLFFYRVVSRDQILVLSLGGQVPLPTELSPEMVTVTVSTPRRHTSPGNIWDLLGIVPFALNHTAVRSLQMLWVHISDRFLKATVRPFFKVTVRMQEEIPVQPLLPAAPDSGFLFTSASGAGLQ